MAGDLLRDGIFRSAQTLGIDPVDLATAMSYETAGTFNPVKAGPRTQWGRHRGLIQWGEPQARKYGVDWRDPIGSQLGENGAVVDYLKDAGVKPGMGLIDVYSAINAGRVGRYGASDANNGGAPGTVADKVRDQMSGHRRNAESLMGNAQASMSRMSPMARAAAEPERQPGMPPMQGLMKMPAQEQGPSPSLMSMAAAREADRASVPGYTSPSPAVPEFDLSSLISMLGAMGGGQEQEPMPALSRPPVIPFDAEAFRALLMS